ncbi:MAG: hypothetical protein IT443_09320 [Phycisphaeraceae bacterium]|nr:hypothetical protein [Phycisphaeraceae bacterium]
MCSLKVAIIGAGTYVHGPRIFHGLTVDHDLGAAEIALMDVDAQKLRRTGRIGRFLAGRSRPKVTISEHTERATALEGADFVICCAAPQMQERHAVDCRIIQKHLPNHIITEFGGIAGIGYSLRQITLAEALAADMRKICPKAWMLMISNPMPRLCQVTQQAGIQTVGFCSVGLMIYRMVWPLFRGQADCGSGFEVLEKTFEAVAGGLNRYAWLLELRDRATGRNLLPALNEKLENGESLGHPRTEAIARQTGYLLTAGDDYINDFLPRPRTVPAPQNFWHGNDSEREMRLRAIAEDTECVNYFIPRYMSWERPIDFVAALVNGRDISFHALDLPNTGQIPQLPRDEFVETPAKVNGQGVFPRKLELPAEVVPLSRHVAEVSRTIVQAALRRSRDLVHQAIDLDLTIDDKQAGHRAIDEVLAAHADMIGGYS